MPRRNLAPGDLVLSSATVENPPFDELLEIAEAGGYAGVTLWPSIYHPRFQSDMSLEDMQQRLDDSPLVVCDMDALVAWVGSGDPGGPYFEEPPERELFELGEALGAQYVNILLHGTDSDLSEADAAEVVASVIERAERHGLWPHLEFSRNRPVGRDLPSTLRIAQLAGAGRVGVLVDTWHIHFGDGSFDDLARADGAAITGFQINDAPAVPPEDLGYATRYARLTPGEGSLDLVGILASLDAIESPAPISIEVFDAPRVKKLGARAFACQLADTVRDLQRRAEQGASD
jgi:sugar phosphate isomerase/epimerase